MRQNWQEVTLTNDEKATFLNGLETALRNVTNPRYFETERGYQGALIAALQQELVGFNWDEAIIESSCLITELL